MVRSLGRARAAALTGTTPEASRMPPASAARSRRPHGASARYSRNVVSGSIGVGDGEEKGIAWNLGEPKIQQHEIEAGLVQNLVSGIGISHRDDLVAVASQRALQGPAKRRLIIHDEYGHEAA